mgnify:FL=1
MVLDMQSAWAGQLILFPDCVLVFGHPLGGVPL